MSHDVTKVLLGVTQSNDKAISDFAGDPATLLAGLCVSLKSDSTLSLLKADGPRMGVSLGNNLSDLDSRVSVLRYGMKVPVRAELKRASGNVTITSYANLLTGTPDTVTIGATAFTAQAGASTPGQAHFTAAVGNNETATSLAAQINAHAVAGTKVYAVASSAIVTLYAKTAGAGDGLTTGNSVALAYADLGTATIGATVSGAALSGGSDTISDISFVSLGTKMYINDVSGKADANIAGYTTISDAIYISSDSLTGIDENGDDVAAVQVDMPGGL
jgi:hypothetical protein